METYSQNSKNRVREEALKYAIRSLTRDRYSSTIAPVTQIRNIVDSALFHYPEQSYLISQLNDEIIYTWEKFYKASIGSKKRYELKVAYLCGPEPENDLNIMIKEGVLPQNVWAFENDNATFENAKHQILRSKYPYLKIVKRNIKDFFQSTSITFDIIYLDFCSTLLDKANIDVLTTLFYNHILSPLGIVITNFSFSNYKDNKLTYKNILSFSSNYLYFKESLETKFRENGDCSEGPTILSYSCPECENECKSQMNSDDFDDFCNPFINAVKKRPEEYYGQCITRFLFDLPSSIIPSQQLFENSNQLSGIIGNEIKLPNALIYNLFSNDENPETKTLHDVPNLLNFLVEESFDVNDWPAKSVYSLYKKTKFNNFLQKINISNKKDQYIDLIKKLFFHELFVSENATQILDFEETSLGDFKNKWSDIIQSKNSFCDVFLFHQLIEILLAQIAVPYFPNIEKTKRWTYKARQHRMFTDLIIFDQGRYLMDWIPTPEMLSELNFDIQTELSTRFILDSFAKNNGYFLNNLFFGGNVVPIDEINFKTMRKRKHIIK